MCTGNISLGITRVPHRSPIVGDVIPRWLGLCSRKGKREEGCVEIIWGCLGETGRTGRGRPGGSDSGPSQRIGLVPWHGAAC